MRLRPESSSPQQARLKFFSNLKKKLPALDISCTWARAQRHFSQETAAAPEIVPAQAEPAIRRVYRGSLPECSRFHPVDEFSSPPTSPPGSERSSADPRATQESSPGLPTRVLLCAVRGGG